VPVEADFQRLIEEAAIPGVAAAVVRGDRLEQILCCGLRSANAPELVDENTVFDAASLAKRLTENELSDFSRLWHDGCSEAIIEAQGVDRNHSPEV
jgi:Beta-lactamase